jgi:predicted membrane-bound mannosyltransferase
MPNPDIDGALMPLPEALRALPQVAPAQSAWPQLAAQLAAQGARDRVKPRRRHFVPAAIAAAIVLAVAATTLLRDGPQPSALSPQVATVSQPAASSSTNATNTANATNPQTATDAGAQLAALQQRSQELEHWLHETSRAAAPLSGQDLAAATEIEDMIGMVDMQLGARQSNGGLPLWRHRVALLEDLTVLRYSSYSVAASGIDAKALMPTNWTN